VLDDGHSFVARGLTCRVGLDAGGKASAARQIAFRHEGKATPASSWAC